MKKIFDHEKTVPRQDDDMLFFVGCNYRISNAIFEEFLKRFFAPIFIIIIGLTSSLIITSSKDENFYKSKNIFKFLIGVSFVFYQKYAPEFFAQGVSILLAGELICLSNDD